MKKAAIFLVKASEDEWGDMVIDDLEKLYPGIIKAMKRGDIIENINESGYRSNGIRFFNGEKIIDQNTTIDDYGSPPIEFKVISEFSVGYWTYGPYGSKEDHKAAYVNNDFEDGESEFYWHCDNPSHAIDLKALGIDNLVDDLCSVTNGNYYIVVEIDDDKK